MEISIIITAISIIRSIGPREKLINSGLIKATTERNTVSINVVKMALKTTDFSWNELYMG